jgi:hypothetical protein
VTRAPLLAAAALATIAAPAGARPGTSCLADSVHDGAGWSKPFPDRDARAAELNDAGKTLYRQGKWDEAREKYRAAAALDARFFAPRLNIACSFVRQERFGEATAELLPLVGEGYVPWAREIMEAADLGALKVRPEMKQLDAAMAAAAAHWGEGLDRALLYVARARPSLRVPDQGAGVFILSPHQDVWAFSPETRRYRQVTAEEGHVLLMAPAPDRRRLVYVTAEKLVRGGARGTDLALRGVVVHVLDLSGLSSQPPARVEGDVRRLAIAAGAGGAIVVDLDSDRARGLYGLTPAGGLPALTEQLVPRRQILAVLTPQGAQPLPRRERRFGDPGCPVTAREGAGGTIVVSAGGVKPLPLEVGAGAGLVGLPIP